jgi:hypothetical protein
VTVYATIHSCHNPQQLEIEKGMNVFTPIAVYKRFYETLRAGTGEL